PQNLAMETPEMIQVPGKWDLQLDDVTPYGYGSYRLQITVDPDKHPYYSIHIPSIRSASEIYVNGQYDTGSGKVATTEENYRAKNLPYTAQVMPDEEGVMDIVIQAANFKDIRR